MGGRKSRPSPPAYYAPAPAPAPPPPPPEDKSGGQLPGLQTDFSSWDNDALKVKLLNYEPTEWAVDLNINCCNLLLIGVAGVGKSSFINSVITVLRGSLQMVADAHGNTDHVTENLHQFMVNPDDPIRLLDMPGYELGGANRILARLDDVLRGRFVVGTNLLAQQIPAEDIVANPRFKNEVHGVFILFPYGGTTNAVALAELKAIVDKIRAFGIMPLLGLSKVDLEYKDSPLEAIFRTAQWIERARAVSTQTGVDLDMILPIVNLIQQQGIEPKAAHLVLEALDRLVGQADSHFENVQTGRVARANIAN